MTLLRWALDLLVPDAALRFASSDQPPTLRNWPGVIVPTREPLYDFLDRIEAECDEA